MKEKISIELDIQWQNGKAEWGQFVMYILDYSESHYNDTVFGWGDIFHFGDSVKRTKICYDTEELAQQACATALKKILIGIKE